LQSTQPMPAVVHPSRTQALSASVEKIVCHCPIVGQSSGLPASSRITRFGSVAQLASVLRSFLSLPNTVIGMWLPTDFDIFCLPSVPSTLGTVVSAG
jgi:hypothetical protein